MRNKFEQKIANQLKKAGVKFEYEKCRLGYTLKGWYIPDFVLPQKAIIIECKGYFRPEAKRKMVAVKQTNPLADIRIIFYNRNLSYIKWADKHGFPWAIESLPKEWLA